MANRPLPEHVLQEARDALAKYKTQAAAAAALGISRATLQSRLLNADRVLPKQQPDIRVSYPIERAFVGKSGQAAADTEDLCTRIKRVLRKAPASLDAIAAGMNISRGAVLDAIDTLKAAGVNICHFGEEFSIETAPAPQYAADGGLPVYTSRPDNTFLYGFTSDGHMGSKYERLDVINDLYDRFAEAGVDRVFNAGNWIDGEKQGINKFDLHTHGMDAQLAYLAKHYPQREGIVTYAVAGDDHEGWYCQREGVDIGAYAELKMRQAGREDFVNLGYIEAFVELTNANSGQNAKLLVCHPGGGSAYAISYTSQKSIEAFEGGEKPAVALFGHYHKMMYACIRNVHAIQTGCCEDQTPFMRKKKLSAHVGGGICRLTQDPVTGAITSCTVQFFNYFNQGYYNDRWSMSGAVNNPERKRP